MNDVVIEVLICGKSQHGVRLAAAGEETIPHAGRVQALFVLGPDPRGLLPVLAEVRLNLGLVSKVVRDHRVDVIQADRRVLLRNLFGGGAGVEGGYQGIERHARAADVDHSVSIGLNRNPLRWNVQLH